MSDQHVGREICHSAVESNKVGHTLVKHLTPRIKLRNHHRFATNTILPGFLDAQEFKFQIINMIVIGDGIRILYHFEEETSVTWFDIDALQLWIIDLVHLDEVRVNFDPTVLAKE